MNELVVKDNGITGILYGPSKTTKKLPGIILLSGSDGGIPGTNAIPKSFIEELVNSGFIVLALAYFGINDLPQNLSSISLEYFEKAVQWLQNHVLM